MYRVRNASSVGSKIWASENVDHEIIPGAAVRYTHHGIALGRFLPCGRVVEEGEVATNLLAEAGFLRVARRESHLPSRSVDVA